MTALECKKIEEESLKITYQNWQDSWAQGLSFHYWDERTRLLGEDYAVQANPDGSEDLVKISHDEQQTYFSVVRRLADKGKGKYSFLLVSQPVKTRKKRRLLSRA